MTIILLILGLFTGSFLGVFVERTHLKSSFVKGRSHCDFCKKTLAWYDLVPLLSFLFLKGRCRYCHKKLPLFYPATELITGILFTLTWITFSYAGLATVIFYIICVFILISIFFYDLKYGIIPDNLIVLGTIASFLYFLLAGKDIFLNHFLAAAGSFIFFIVISFVFLFITKKESMGGGDIKLSFLLGLILGLPNIIISLYIAFLTGAIVSIILVLWRKKSFRKDSLPFGPFLILGAFIALFYGNFIFPEVLRILGIY